MREVFVFTKAAMLLGVLVFFVFWYIPSMRSTSAYNEAMGKVFDAATSCSDAAFREERYGAVRICYEPWEKWQAKNTNPEPAWNMPWHVWKETL